MILGVPKESFPGERRVAIVPALSKVYQKLGLDVCVETGAGIAAGFPDSEYEEVGFRVVEERPAIYRESDVVIQVRGLGANPDKGQEDVALFRPGQIQIGFLEPLTERDSMARLSEAGVTSLSMEMMPRITRAQSMDALSSMATIAGYKSVLLAADSLPRMFPMLMTAAGTVSPARVFVVGVGVAGLQAIATAKRLGAVVSAYDIRPAVKDQVKSVGGKFIELELDAGSSEDKGGYAREMDEAFYEKQREMMIEVVHESDVVITTAAIPGKKAPILVTGEMVEAMAPGSLVIDLAAERGGNCELTKPGEDVQHQGVTIMGPLNLPSTIPYHASQMYAKNVATFLSHLTQEEQVTIDPQDEIVRETLITRDGEIAHPRVREAFGLPPLTPSRPEFPSLEGDDDGN